MANALLNASLWADSIGTTPSPQWTGSNYEVMPSSLIPAELHTLIQTINPITGTVGFTLTIVTPDVSDASPILQVLVNDVAVWTQALGVAGSFVFSSSALADATVVLFFRSAGGYAVYRGDYIITPTPELPTHNCDCNDTTGNKTLKQLRDDLAVRLGFGAQVNNLPPGMTVFLNSFLIEAQELLYRRYDVLRTERFYSWALQQGVRMYDFSANAETCTKRLDPRKVTWAGVEHMGIWYPMICGIPPELYSNNITIWRPSHYEIRQCIEVWPPPAATEGNLIIKGHFGLEAFAADTDTTTIDDRPIFLLALANAKAHYGKPDARNYIEQLETMLLGLVAGSHQTRKYVPGGSNRVDYVYTMPKPTVPFS